jgi:hypothetical protein
MGWAGYWVKEQTVEWDLGSGNGNHYFDEDRVKSLSTIAPYLRGLQNVEYSHENLLGYLYLLHAKPVYLHFRFNPVYYKHLAKLKGPEFIYETTFLELNWKKFPDDFKRWLETQQVDGWKLEQIVVERFTVYRFVKIL